MDSAAVALIEAAQAGDYEQVKELLENTHPDACNPEYRRTALHWACEGGHVQICSALLDAKASVNLQDRSGATPLHWAAWNGHAAVCQLLIGIYQADPSIRDNDGESAQDSATDGAVRGAIREGIAKLAWAADDAVLAKPVQNSEKTTGQELTEASATVFTKVKIKAAFVEIRMALAKCIWESTIATSGFVSALHAYILMIVSISIRYRKQANE